MSSAKGDNHDSENNHYDLDEVQGIKQANFIPLDIVAGVLLRLPAKSIGRLRCVCRQWRSLTHDARFVDQHRTLGGASSPALVASDPIRTNTTIERLSVFEVGPNRDEFKHRFVPIKFDEPSCTDLYAFSNPANGLIGVIGITKPVIFLLNPTTREISRLPKSCNIVERCFRPFGLGFDASSGAYKMVSVSFGSSSCMVLTVGGTGGWRYIGDAPCRVFSRPFSLHGTVYWLADAGVHLGVLAFDVGHETMQFIPAPNILTSAHKSGSLPLHDLGGRLCICIVEASQFLRIWVLTDNHEWKPQYDIDIPLLLNQTGAIQVVAILDGQVLIRTLDDAVYSYDLHRRTLRWICSGGFTCDQGVITDFAHELGVITESLVSPRDLIGMNPI